MRKGKLLNYCILFLAGYSFISCKNTIARDSFSIDVVTAFANPGELSASDYFSKVRYVPLETTDESVVGPGADIQFFGDKLVVTTRQKQCLLFEANTGRFIRSIGHIGNDPEGNKSVALWIDQPSLTLNLEGWNGDWQQYDNQGIYKGKIKLPVDRGFGGNFTYTDEGTTAVYRLGFIDMKADSLFFFNGDQLLTSFAAYPEEAGRPQISDMGDINAIDVMGAEPAVNKYGPAALPGLIIITLKGDDRVNFAFDGSTHFWHLNDALYFKCDFNDTIYQVKNRELIPSRVFELGAYHWPVAEAMNKKHDTSIFITHILESNDLMLFRFSTRLFNEEKRRTYNALYDKRSGQVKLNMYQEGIRDDLTNFMPLQPYTVSPEGVYAGIHPAYEITGWFEDHPDRIAGLPKEVQQLKQVGEEDNPVIVFMK